MYSLFAGAICTGLGCTPLYVVLAVYVVVIVGVVGLLTWAAARIFIHLVNKRRKTPLSRRKALAIKLAAFSLVAIAWFLYWWIPNTSYVQNKHFDEARNNVTRQTVYLPTSLKHLDTKVYVDQHFPRDPSFMTVSHAQSNSGIVKLSQDGNVADIEAFRKQDNMRCGDDNTKDIHYCYNFQGSLTYYWVLAGKTSLEVDFPSGLGELESVAIIRSLEPHMLSTLDKTTYHRAEELNFE